MDRLFPSSHENEMTSRYMPGTDEVAIKKCYSTLKSMKASDCRLHCSRYVYGSPSVRINDGKQDLLVLPCREERASLVVAGQHDNGRWGSTIDETIIPSLAHQKAIELYDQDTNILIYRRRPPSQVVQKQIFGSKHICSRCGASTIVLINIFSIFTKASSVTDERQLRKYSC